MGRKRTTRVTSDEMGEKRKKDGHVGRDRMTVCDK